MKNRKIAIVFDLTHTIELDYCGGLDRAGLYELEGFIERGFEAVIYSGRFIGDGVHTKAFAAPWFYALPKILNRPLINKLLTPFNTLINIFLFYMANRDTDFFIFLNPHLLTLLKPQKCFVQLQMPFDVNFRRFKYVFKLFEKRFMKSHYVFCSEAIRRDYSNNFKWMGKHSSILYNGVDTDRFKPADKPPHDTKRFIFAANWNREKGLDVLLNAVSILEKKRDDFEVVLGGSPSLWKKDNISKAQQVFADHTETQMNALKTVSIRGRINHEDLPSELASQDVFLCPSRFSDPFPLIILEAFACGLPVIGTRAGGIPEAVVHGKTGLIIERDNPQQLADAMEFFLNNPDQIEVMGRVARRSVEEKFSWKHHMETLLKIIEKFETSCPLKNKEVLG